MKDVLESVAWTLVIVAGVALLCISFALIIVGIFTFTLGMVSLVDTFFCRPIMLAEVGKSAAAVLGGLAAVILSIVLLKASNF